MHLVADYDLARTSGFDSPDAAVRYLTDTAYPRMPQGLLRRVETGRAGEVLFDSDRAVGRVIDLSSVHGAVTPAEGRSATGWVVTEFSICESSAKSWAVTK